MKTVERRKRKAEGMRRRIMNAAMKLFVKGGVPGVTMRGVADMIDYSPATIYNYFDNKEAILLELCFQGFQHLLDMQTALDELPDPVERLHRGCKAYLRFAMEHPDTYELMFGARELGHQVHMDDESPPMRSFARLMKVVGECQDAGLFAGQDTLAVSLTVWSTLHGLAHLSIKDRYDFLPDGQREEALDRAVDFALRACAGDSRGGGR